jgi:hypothetical protein
LVVSAPLTADQLLALAQAPRALTDCPDCGALRCAGWESLPGDFDERHLEWVGTLRDGSDEPTWAEYHPAGTRLDSPEAPIALGYFPYNRCDVHVCRRCRRPFLRYTEGGGYYVDRRIRDLTAARIVG